MKLIVIKGTDEGKQFDLADAVVGLGRDASNRIRLHDTEISRRHAEFCRTPQGYHVRDVGSANGTFVNGRLIGKRLGPDAGNELAGVALPEHELSDGDALGLGGLTFRVRIDGTATRQGAI